MNKQVPFFSQIKKICDTKKTYDRSDKIVSLNDSKWIHNISWISKFTFDYEWNLYKKKKVNSNHNEILNNFSCDFNPEKFNTKYPHLKELISTNINYKNNHLKNIITCFEKDKDEIIKLFNLEKNTSLIDINLGEGDAHQYGKSAAIIHLSNNKKIVYKPRSGKLDLAFNTLLKEINSAKIGIDFKPINLLNKETYSWIEHINQQSISKKTQAKGYYKRSGALIALSYFLMGFDLHYENIIANGEYPMLIDLECMFNSKNKEYNVLSIGLIPQLFSTGKNFFDLSGLGANGRGKTMPYWQWENINTDKLNLIKKSSSFKNERNQLFFDKKKINPKEYLNDITEGFECICNWFLEQKKENNIQYLLSGFQNNTIRVLPRSTQLYTNILENSYLPKALKSSKKRTELLNQYLNVFPFLSTIIPEHKASIREGEKKALLRMDIPYFTANTSDLYLEESGEKLIDDYFTITPFKAILNRINKFQKKDIQNQVNLIKDAFAARYKLQKNITEKTTIKHKDSTNIEDELNTIIKKILDTSLESDGKYSWKSYQASATGEIFSGRLNKSLYSGTLGIALFLSEYLKKQGNSKIQQIVDSLIEDIILNFSDFLKTIDQNSYTSLSSGISGVIYALIKIDKEKYKDIALQLTSFFTEDLITNGKTNDFLEGYSGTLVILIKLYNILPSSELLNKIKFIGSKLLNDKSFDDNLGCYVWKSTINKKPLTGLAHGASGIAYSFLKLYELTGEISYRNAFYEAVDFEDIYFSDKENNWVDLRNNKNNFHNAWCYGGAGIGLVRLHAYKILKDPRFLNDVRNIIYLIKTKPNNNLDFYCCGNTGKIDFLLESFTILKENDVFDLANEMIKELIQKKKQEGNYITHEATAISSENPSLFKGLTGIGYVLLRSQNLDKFPCIGLFN